MIYINHIYHDSNMIFSSEIIMIFFIFHIFDILKISTFIIILTFLIHDI